MTDFVEKGCHGTLTLKKKANRQKGENTGKLRIGDNWNAIRIIALSQSNPLKAVAEFVENSIDAKARIITLVRGKEKGVHFLRIKDDGEGIRKNPEGVPDFEFVATHICDSVKRRLKAEGASGLQGEFGIGLLSFWTVGEEMTLTSAGTDGKTYQMHMKKGDPGYRISQKRLLVQEPGTELVIRNILPGIKQFSGEKINWYLASELRDRIRSSGVDIRVIDRTARAEFKVEPRKFEGRLLHEVNRAGEIYRELYLSAPHAANTVELFRNGTRVAESLTGLPDFNKPPWNSGYLQGLVDVPFINLTPGTRSGLIQDEAYQRMIAELAPLEAELLRIIGEQRRAEDEQTSREVLRSIQKALKEALLALPAEEYDWFDLHGEAGSRKAPGGVPAFSEPSAVPERLVPETVTQPSHPGGAQDEPAQKQFFEFPGPLYSVRISPASSIVSVGGSKNFRAIARDRANRLVEENIAFSWTIAEGEGALTNAEGEIATLEAGKEPGLVKLLVLARQGEIECSAEALVTVTETLIAAISSGTEQRQGIPSYTFEKAAGELWRSRYDAEKNLVVINSGHRDFVFASRNKALKLRYISRLFAKELVVKNFAGAPAGELLERLIELSLYTEENLK